MLPSNITLQDLNTQSRFTLAEHIGIEFTAYGADWLEAVMPVDNRTRQPYGILHGGASAALAETLGSVGSYFLVDPEKFRVAGLEINANHIRSSSSGNVTGRATLVHQGHTTHIWEIRITGDDTRLVCIARLTVIVLKKEGL